MNYTVKLTKDSAEIVGLPDVYLHFAHLRFSTVWDSIKGRHVVDHNVSSYYGGMGEGSKFDNWQDAIHSSLYDAFQVEEAFHDGDVFMVRYYGKVANFRCDGVHVVRM